MKSINHLNVKSKIKAFINRIVLRRLSTYKAVNRTLGSPKWISPYKALKVYKMRNTKEWVLYKPMLGNSSSLWSRKKRKCYVPYRVRLMWRIINQREENMQTNHYQIYISLSHQYLQTSMKSIYHNSNQSELLYSTLFRIFYHSKTYQ